jgi:PAS domain S-box-containing protein
MTLQDRPVRVTAVRNLAERKRAEEALRASEAKYRRLHESMMDGFARVDLQGRILESNAVFQSMLGYTDEELQALNILEVTPQRWHSRELEIVELVLRRGYSDVFEKEYRGKGGATFPVEIRMFLLRDDAGTATGLWAIVRDITERKRTEEALRASERKYKHFFEQDLAGHYVSTPDGRVIACNSAFARILGFASAEEAIGADVASRYLPSRAREDFLRRLRVNGRVDRLETELRRKDGAAVAVIESAVGVHDDRGDLHEIQGFLLDDTERKEVEAEFRQAQKMEAVGRLAGGVAHDFNNLLGVIMGHTELLEGRLADGDPKHAKLEEIRKAAERGAGLTRQLLAFSRKQVLQPRVLDLNHLVTAMESMLRRLIGEDIRLMTVLPDGLGQVMADEGQIEQVLMNLAVNARDAMPHGGTLTIETGHSLADAAYRTLHPEVVPGPQLVLSVHDTGHGMDATTLAHIFEPFFTTKEEGKGTGLGLATVRDVVEHSGGVIRVESAPGQGTTFEIDWPMLDADYALAETGAVADEPPRGQETILLVEDDGALRRLLGTQLSGLGYTVLQAAGGPEALLVAEAHAGAIDLVLTDVVMEEVNGRDVVALLTHSRPHIKSLYMSGHDDHVIVQQLRTHHPGALLEKPVGAHDLARRVRLALSS